MKQYSLSRKAIDEYKENYKKEFGIELSFEKAETEAIKLLCLFKIIYQPIERKKLIKNES